MEEEEEEKLCLLSLFFFFLSVSAAFGPFFLHIYTLQCYSAQLSFAHLVQRWAFISCAFSVNVELHVLCAFLSSNGGVVILDPI